MIHPHSPVNAAGLPFKRSNQPRVPVNGLWHCTRCQQHLPRSDFPGSSPKPQCHCKACRRAHYHASKAGRTGNGSTDFDDGYIGLLHDLYELAAATRVPFKEHMKHALAAYLAAHSLPQPEEWSWMI